QEKGILFAPDYIINSGGLIQVADELYGANQERVMMKTKEIYHILLEVYKKGETQQMTTIEEANVICENKIANRTKRNHFYSRYIRSKSNNLTMSTLFILCSDRY